VLIFDGVFLLRPELFENWDLRIFVSASFKEILRRALDRDAALLGSREEVERRYRTRYIPGQQLYFAQAHPAGRSDVLVDNEDPVRPRLMVRSACYLRPVRVLLPAAEELCSWRAAQNSLGLQVQHGARTSQRRKASWAPCQQRPDLFRRDPLQRRAVHIGEG
jgi:hypothetical protein